MASVSVVSEFTIKDQSRTNRRGPIRWLISHALHYIWLFVTMVIGAISNAALAAVVPIIIGKVFNAILSKPPNYSWLLTGTLIILFSQLLRGILQFARNFSAEVIGQRLERDIRHELYVSLLGKSMTFHSLHAVGDTMARATNDVREINLMFSPGVNLVVGSALFLIMPVILAPRYAPSLILTPIVYIIVYIIAIWRYLHELQPITNDVRRSFGDMNKRLAEAIDGIETVKGLAQEKAEVCHFGKDARRFRDAFVRQGDIEARFLPLLLLGIAQAAGLFHSLILYQDGILSLGDVVGYFGLLQLFQFPTFVSLFAYSQVSLGISSAKRILELINDESDLDQNIKGLSKVVEGEVEFHNVDFSYEKGKTVLDDISFHVRPGQTVAIVGQTGAGKTTMVKLINRIYDVESGQVNVDGIDVRDWNLEELRRNISIIEQDIFLFSKTIRDNIAFGNPQAREEQIISAAKAAQADEFIRAFKDGYDTVIGERGVTLSGGQRQRLALARAFLTNPKILVLDDSTSAIDSATEDKIQQAIFNASRGRTTFIITHRLSQIRWADLILVLRKGELVAMGNHDELLRSSEVYQRIFKE